MLSTKRKLALAAAASTVLAGARRLVGRPSTVTVRRGGHRWALDLGEGIDLSIYLLGGFERGTAAALRRVVRPGDTVLDIGANVGAHTLGLAASVGPAGCVVAVEPTDAAFAKLARNVALNPELERRVRLRQLLLAESGDVPMPNALYSSWPLAPTGTVHPKHGGRLVPTSGAGVSTLDALVRREALGRVDVVKLDVDGFEARVLAGGRDTLARDGPVLVMELAPYVHVESGHGLEAVTEVLTRAGYEATEVGAGRPVPLDPHWLHARIPDGASLNVIARPGADRRPASGRTGGRVQR